MELFKLALLLRMSPKFLMKFFPQAINLYDYVYKPYPEVIDLIKSEMGWKSHEESFEHLDCRLHEIPFYIDTRMVEGITAETLHNSALVRQGILSRDRALEIEKGLAEKTSPPGELVDFLRANGLSLADFERSYTEADPARFVSGFEKLIRKLYHAFYYRRP
jgi:hypothetical protein